MNCGNCAKLIVSILRNIKENGLNTENFDNVNAEINRLDNLNNINNIKDNIDNSSEENIDTSVISPAAEEFYYTKAKELLAGEGLNLSSLMRVCGLKNKERKNLQDIFDNIIVSMENEIYKQGHDWFYGKKSAVKRENKIKINK